MKPEEFVLDRVENPHPRMLAGAVLAREKGGDFWWGYMCARAAPLAGHTHKNCANCYDYAAAWRARRLV